MNLIQGFHRVAELMAALGYAVDDRGVPEMEHLPPATDGACASYSAAHHRIRIAVRNAGSVQVFRQPAGGSVVLRADAMDRALAHELTHALQPHALFSGYIRPEDDYAGYRAQPCEQQAYAVEAVWAYQSRPWLDDLLRAVRGHGDPERWAHLFSDALARGHLRRRECPHRRLRHRLEALIRRYAA